MDVVRHWQDLGYLIIYVTGRPCMQLQKVFLTFNSSIINDDDTDEDDENYETNENYVDHDNEMTMWIRTRLMMLMIIDDDDNDDDD